jgi:hypothetical protein
MAATMTPTEKLESARATLTKLREKLAPSMQNTGLALAGGALAAVTFDVAGDRLQILRDRWWVKPALMAVAGHFLKQKNHDLGVGILGAAGYVLAQDSKISFAARAITAQSVPQARGVSYEDVNAMVANGIQNAIGQLTAPSMQAQGYIDAGAYVSDAGAYVSDAGAL